MHRFPALAAALLAGLLPAVPAGAQVFIVTDPAHFQGLIGYTQVEASFEELAPGPLANGYASGSFVFNSPLANLRVVAPGHAGSNPVPTSQALTCDGPDDFEILLPSFWQCAVGFEFISNRFAAPVVEVYEGSNLLATRSLPVEPNTRTFVGIATTVPVSRVRLRAEGGEVEDVVIDDVRTHTSCETAAKPATWGAVKAVYR